MGSYGAFDHPGFPAIGAIEKFRMNTDRAFASKEAEFKKEAEQIRVNNKPTPIQHNGRTAMKRRKQDESPLQMNAYFDKSVYKSLLQDIKEEVEQLGEDLIEEALFESLSKTSREIRGMTNFKSKISPTKPASGDLYETIGESLNFTKTHFSSTNQFVSYEAGSFDEGENSPQEGVRGSRMDNTGETLITLTEEGTSPFEAHLVSNVFKFPAKRHG